jgi:hypothetical protein
MKKKNSQRSMTWILSTIVTNTMNCLKYRNQFVDVKNQQVYRNRDPLKLLEILNENKIDTRYVVIELIKYR